MILYGLGTTVGAGIYALIGEIAGIAGYFSPLAFAVAALMAGLTAGSFAELSSRLPRAAGAALYTQQGFGSVRLGRVVGLLVALAGVVSAAALVNGFLGYASYFVAFNDTALAIVVVVCLAGIASWGIAESVTVAALITVVEVLGLAAVILTGADSFTNLPTIVETLEFDLHSAPTILSGALLAFYAFIGFEDMVDVAEEVKDARRNLPRAIVWTLAITMLLYMLVASVAVLSIAPDELAVSDAPLADLFARNTGVSGSVIGFIGMFAIINGALIQAIMASRVLYGLSSRGQLPARFARIHPRTRTPLFATLTACVVILMLALVGNLAGLATATSLIMLVIFAVVNLALWRIKTRSRSGDESPPGFEVPRWWPLVGFLVCVLLVGHALTVFHG
jgi:amino acid transporter